MNEKNIKIAKRADAFKGYASSYNVEILNSFNPELQLKDTESAIKSKLIGKKIFYIKSVITEHPQTSHKLCKTIRQAEEIGSNSSLYSDTKKRENSLNEKDVKITKRAIKSKLIELLAQLKAFKFVTTLVLVYKKMESKHKIKYGNFYSSSKAEIIINESDIDYAFKSIYTTTIIENTQKPLGKGSGWIIDLVIDHTISISKYNLLAESSYIKLPK